MDLGQFKQLLNMLWAEEEDIQIAISNISNLDYTKTDILLIYKLLPLKVKAHFKNVFDVIPISMHELSKKCTTSDQQECLKYIRTIYENLDDDKVVTTLLYKL